MNSDIIDLTCDEEDELPCECQDALIGKKSKQIKLECASKEDSVTVTNAQRNRTSM